MELTLKTRDKILQIAEEEFARIGYDALSMNDLVKKLNINKATIYYHFEDKKSLYQEVIKNTMTQINHSIETILEEDLDISPKDKFRLFIHQLVNVFEERPTIVPLALREFANFGENVDESITPYMEIQNEFIKKAMEELNLKDKYKEVNVYSFFSLINGTIMNFYPIQMSQLPVGGDDKIKLNSKKSLEYIADFVADIILDAICKE